MMENLAFKKKQDRAGENREEKSDSSSAYSKLESKR